MRIVNQAGQTVAYWISSPAHGAECGEIVANGYADHPRYDDDTDVYVGFKPPGANTAFNINCAQTGQGEQVKIQLIVG
jgi:hypothetical protein